MATTDARPLDLLILGLGNVLCADDGLGVAAVERLLERYDLPAGVQALDGGTLGLSLLGVTTEAKTLLLVDAIRSEDPPGTMVRMEGEEVAPAVRERLSVHQIGVSDLLDSMQLIDRYPPRLLLLGLVPESLELRASLSPSVEQALDALVSEVARTCAELGHGLASRTPSRKAGDGQRTEGVETRPVQHVPHTALPTPLPSIDPPSAESLHRTADHLLDHVPVERLH